MNHTIKALILAVAMVLPLSAIARTPAQLTMPNRIEDFQEEHKVAFCTAYAELAAQVANYRQSGQPASKVHLILDGYHKELVSTIYSQPIEVTAQGRANRVAAAWQAFYISCRYELR